MIGMICNIKNVINKVNQIIDSAENHASKSYDNFAEMKLKSCSLKMNEAVECYQPLKEYIPF